MQLTSKELFDKYATMVHKDDAGDFFVDKKNFVTALREHNKTSPKIYKWNGRGVYLGAVVIVLADNKKDAKELIETELNKNRLSLNDSDKIEEITNSKIIYFYDGDY